MKKLLIAAFAFTTVAVGPIVHPPVARADEPAAAADTQGQFELRYSLDTFQIASNSLRLAGRADVASGTVEINETTHQLRLTLNRHLNCPRGVMCIQMLDAPTVLTLPIRQEKTEPCGTTIVAERNLQLVDGGLTRVEVQDPNASIACNGNADDVTFVKRVKVLVDETGLRAHSASLSVMSGFPAHR